MTMLKLKSGPLVAGEHRPHKRPKRYPLPGGVVVQCDKVLAARLEVDREIKGELLLLVVGKDSDDAGGTLFKGRSCGALLVQIGKSQNRLNIRAEFDPGVE